MVTTREQTTVIVLEANPTTNRAPQASTLQLEAPTRRTANLSQTGACVLLEPTNFPLSPNVTLATAGHPESRSRPSMIPCASGVVLQKGWCGLRTYVIHFPAVRPLAAPRRECVVLRVSISVRINPFVAMAAINSRGSRGNASYAERDSTLESKPTVRLDMTSSLTTMLDNLCFVAYHHG